MVAVEDGADNFEALLDALVRRPASPRPHLGVGSVAVQRFGILLAPRAQKYSFCFHFSHDSHCFPFKFYRFRHKIFACFAVAT